jgi:phosphosulfolactate synthase
MGFLKLPDRTKKQRSFGITSIVDFGVATGELKHILTDYSDMIDIAKIGIGSAYVTANLKQKLALYKAYDVKPYCGGTLFEKFYLQNKFDDYLMYLKELGVQWIEISSGVLDIPIEERLQLVLKAESDFNVIAEVGSKDPEKQLPVGHWTEEMNTFLEAGCQYVITEGRSSGTSGIYNNNGEIRSEIILEVFQHVDPKKVIFEAPTAKNQAFFINQVGTNVNLGNVSPRDVLLLETQRLGLRSETFLLEEDECKQFS